MAEATEMVHSLVTCLSVQNLVSLVLVMTLMEMKVACSWARKYLEALLIRLGPVTPLEKTVDLADLSVGLVD